MNTLIEELSKLTKFQEYINSVKQHNFPITIFGLTDVAKSHFISATYLHAKKPICIVTYNELQAKKLIHDLEFFSEEQILFLGKKEIVAYDVYAESKDYLHKRIEVLNKIYEGNAQIIVTTIEALMQKIITKEELYQNIIRLKLDDTVDLEVLKSKLVSLGYKRCELIEGKGEFSVRGGIVDISPAYGERGIRLEFFGDTVDSIRHFDIVSQRSTEMLKEITIYPAHEYISNICSNTLFHYLSEDGLLFIDEKTKIKERCSAILKDNQTILQNLIEKGKKIPEGFENELTFEEIEEQLKERNTIYIEQQNSFAKRNEYSFSCREVNFFRSSFSLFLEEAKKAKEKHKTIIILGGNHENVKRLSEALFSNDIENNSLKNELKPGNVYLTEGYVSGGFEYEDLNLIVISSLEFFSEKKDKKKRNKIKQYMGADPVSRNFRLKIWRLCCT